MKPSLYSSKYDKLRAWLKAKREERGLTVRDAADAWGRHYSIVGKLEHNRRRIDIMEFVEYCQVLRIDPHEALDILIATPRKEANPKVQNKNS